uniref:DNA replication fork stabilization factor DONSON n=1 Tax=Sinocyclocheilus anshuiensis TaxID=1608454 RepID=A0A671RIS4_9TELE
MAELGCYSPSFKKPSEVLRMRRKRARSEGPDRRTVDGLRPFSPVPLLNAPSRASGGGKRRNPLANIENTYNSPKKRALSHSDGHDGTPVSLSEDAGLFEEDLFEPERSAAVLKVSGPEAVCDAAPAEVCLEFPADWSLKTRLLFTSPQSFSWAEHLKAQEEAQGLSSHCRAEFSSLPAHIQLVHGSICTSVFNHSCRFGSDRVLSQQINNKKLVLCVCCRSVSLTSLYSLLKARLCPYFYLCSYQFTVLFRAAGLSGAKGLSALLSPTTRGLREAMKAEGIEFSLPLLCVPHLYDDDGGFSWLKEMGVQDKIKKPDAISIKLRKEHREVRLDHRPESVVLVVGSNTFTLLNFLINCKSLVAGAGSQAGLPPTLLAPTAFRGATLHTLKARTVNVKTQVRMGYQDVCSLEVTGPIMPHTLHALTQLLKPAQKGEFSVGLYTHEPTAVLNLPLSQTSEPQQLESVVQDLGRCGLQQSSIQQLATPSMLGKSALRQLHMRDYSYSWKS